LLILPTNDFVKVSRNAQAHMGYHVGVRVIVNDGELSPWQLARRPPLEPCSVGWKLLRWSSHPDPSLSRFRPVVPLTLNFQEWLQQVFNDPLVSESDIIVNANEVAPFRLSHTFVSGFPVRALCRWA
jgi:hypothetical protein